MVIFMIINCEIGDVVRIKWIDVGSSHEFYPVSKVNELLAEMKKDFTMTTYGEVVYLKGNDIGVTYTRTEKDIHLIYLRKELIESLEVLESRKSL